MTSIGRKVRDRITPLAMTLLLASCGGGGGGSGTSTGILSPTPTPTPTPVASTCSLSSREAWALAQVNEWYLFPETLSYVNPAAFSNLSDYVDALTAGARAQGEDRYFTYVTSISQEDAYYNSGATAGFGVRLSVDDAAMRVWVSEAFEGTPALNAGLDRGTEILAIGTSASSLRSVRDIIASEGDYGIYDALGQDNPGVSRVLQVQDASGVRTVTIAKADYDIQPVSPRYGLRIIDDGGRKVGYINLRTFIYSAQDELRSAFAQLKAQGIDDVIIDLRYNGGGLLAVAQTLGSLLGGAQHPTDVFAQLRYRPEKSAENESYYFQSEASAIAPRHIAFIGTQGTASASELVMNAFRPYLNGGIALVGSNTYGKPVGQIALDQTACDDRLRLIAFAVVNADGQGGYYGGIASVMPATCKAEDDLNYPLGDPREDSVAKALDYLDGRACTPIGGTTLAKAQAQTSIGNASVATAAPQRHPLMPAKPTEPQREMPGLL